MGFRKKKTDTSAQRKWQQFVADHATLILEAGLPTWITDDKDYWGDILHYGYPEQVYGHVAYSLSWFDVTEIGEAQFAALINLVELYFDAGFLYDKPLGIKQRSPKEFNRLVGKFDPAASDEKR